MLSLLLLIPIIGSLLLLTIPENSIENKIRMKRITLITMLINFLISIYILLEFDSSTSQYQFVYEFIELSYCHLNIGIDGISLYFVLLTTFVSPIAVLSNYNNINNNLKYFLISFLLLETLQIGVFVVLDLLQIYSYVGSTDFQIISLSEINLNSQKIL